jgi:hypothetical protein
MKKVKINESDLVKLMTRIVSEAVAQEKAQLIESEKKKWLAEQKEANKKLLESAVEKIKKEMNG